MEWIVLAAVHAEREHALVAGEDLVRPVALVHVEVDDRGARDLPFGLQRADRDCHVVEDAESLATIGEGVMRPSGEVHRDA